jgi:hypothetical protein
LLLELAYQANNGQSTLKVGDTKICDSVIYDTDLDKDWLDIFNGLSEVVKAKEEFLLRRKAELNITLKQYQDSKTELMQ